MSRAPLQVVAGAVVAAVLCAGCGSADAPRAASAPPSANAAVSAPSAPGPSEQQPAATKPPGPASPDGTPSERIRSFLATGGRPCTAADLRAQFRIGAEGAGNLGATVYVGNTSNRECAVTGPVTLVGLDKSGTPDTPVDRCQTVDTAGQECPAPAVLPAHATVTDLTAGSAPGAEYLAVLILGAYRDDPQSPDGLCTPADTVTPYTLRLSFGDLTISVRNWDPADTSLPTGIHALFACHGAIRL